MYIIEVFHKGKWEELAKTKRSTKADLEAEVAELNKSIPKETMKYLPVSRKYRVKKTKTQRDNNI